MIMLIKGIVIFAGLTYLIRKVFGSSRTPFDLVSSERFRTNSVIEGTRQKPW